MVGVTNACTKLVKKKKKKKKNVLYLTKTFVVETLCHCDLLYVREMFYITTDIGNDAMNFSC